MCISYLHGIDVAANETLSGYPYVACEYENEIDCFLVISEQLRDFLINSGVNEERIRIGRDSTCRSAANAGAGIAAGRPKGSASVPRWLPF